MNKETNCPIVRDLLPSYLEEMTEEETNRFVERHLAECEACRAVRMNMLGGEKPESKAQAELIERLRQARMRRKWLTRIGVLLAAILAAVCLLPLPVRVDKTIEAYRWSLDQPESEDRLVSMTIRGYYMRQLFFDDYFDGDIMIEGIPVTQREGSFTRCMIDEGGDMGLFYQDDEGFAVDVGRGCVLPGLEGFVFSMYEAPDENGVQTWSSDTGLMLTYPARTRAEAVETAKEITSPQGHWLRNVNWDRTAEDAPERTE